MKQENSIISVKLVGEKTLRRSPEIEMERHRALSDLLHHNRFEVKGFEDQQPYKLTLEVVGSNLVITLYDRDDHYLTKIDTSIKSVKKTIKDYFMMCDSFFKMARSGDTGKIEAIDMGRRAIHNEGAEYLVKKLAKYADCDFSTARQLFTLICVLHIRIAAV